MTTQATSSSAIALSGRESCELIGRLMTPALLVLAGLIIAAIVQIIRLGSTGHLWFLLIGSALSGVALFAFAVFQGTVNPAQQRRGLGLLLAVFGGFVPYGFACVLVFYEGFWRMRALLDGFIWSTLIIAVLFVCGGYQIVKATYRLTQLGDRLKAGAIVVVDAR